MTKEEFYPFCLTFLSLQCSNSFLEKSPFQPSAHLLALYSPQICTKYSKCGFLFKIKTVYLKTFGIE